MKSGKAYGIGWRQEMIDRPEVIVVDFGGVIAEEGFHEGLGAIARANGVDEEPFFRVAKDLVYDTGYATGSAREGTYWQAVREATGITGSDVEFRREILDRFTLRDDALDLLVQLKQAQYTLALLTDQTNWLTEIEREMPFLQVFDYVFNSYTMGTSKREIACFETVTRVLGVRPAGVWFFDDSEENIAMARKAGWQAFLVKERDDLRKALDQLLTKEGGPLGLEGSEE